MGISFKTWSIKQATHYYEVLISEIEELCKNPLASKSLESVKPNYRARLVKSHMIIFKIEDKRIFVVRILHQQMDIESIMKD